MGGAVCAYCGQSVLTGDERPEHPLPETVNGRLTTRLVCDPCNTWAGKNIDQPWLSDSFVGHVRFVHRIPDRRNKVLEYDPLLAGVTAEGVQIRMDEHGRPIPLNSPVNFDPDSGTYQIRAKDEEDVKRLFDRIAKKAAAEGKTATPTGEPEAQSYQPSVTVKLQIMPQTWERMAAKVLLGFLAENLPADWRSSAQADALRAVMRSPDKAANQVRLTDPGAMQQIAAAPASAAFTRQIGGNTVGGVSLLGIFMLGFVLPPPIAAPGLLWISDPLQPSWSVMGPWESALAQRLSHFAD